MSSMKSQLEKQSKTYHYEIFNMITNEFSGKDFTTDDLMERFFGVKNFTPKEVKKVKDPDAPKRAQSAYFLFCGDRRPGVMEKMKKDGKVDVTAVSKELGEVWRNMSEKDKKPFVKMAKKDKERYTKEKEEYEQSKVST